MPKAYKLPERLRPRLAKPLGRFFSAEGAKRSTFRSLVNEAPMVITVGDRVTETVGGIGRTPDVQIVDSRENRKRRAPPEVPFARLVRVENPAGSLTQQAIEGVRSALNGKKPVRILVDGEEDLMAIPAIALAPVSALVFYGQPGQGVVVVKTDARSKSRNRTVLAAMGISEMR